MTSRERRIVTLYAQGMTREQVAREAGVSQATVSRVHARYGIPMRTRGGANYKRLPDKELDATVSLYLAGYSEPEIADFLGLTRGGVTWRLDRMKVKRRTISQALKLRYVDKPEMVVILTGRGRYKGLDKRKGKSKV
jgi:DNA-binding CsgD family transcriptional regulator